MADGFYDMVNTLMSIVHENAARSIQKKVLIQASPARIFRALTSARDIVHWFCDRAICHPRLGGELTAIWRMGKTTTKGRLVFTQLVLDSLVQLQWNETEDKAGQENTRRIFTYFILLKRELSEVTLIDEAFPVRGEETYEELDKGWNYVLQDFKEHCEKRERAAKHSRARER